jgi:Cu2+-exporting ATPase
MPPLHPHPAIHAQDDASKTYDEQSLPDECCVAKLEDANVECQAGPPKVDCGDKITVSSDTESNAQCCERVKPPSRSNGDTYDSGPGSLGRNIQEVSPDACCQGNSIPSGFAESTTGKVGCQAKESGSISPCASSGPVPKKCCDSVPLSRADSATNKPKVADCCRGKASPCCDETCLDRLALRECTSRSLLGDNDSGRLLRVNREPWSIY